MDLLQRKPATDAPDDTRPWLTPARRRATVVALIALATLFFIATIRDGHAWGDDFAQYIGHARNLISGNPYEATGYLYNPAVPFGGPRTYPPVFPLLLAPAVKAFGVSLTVLKIEVILFFAGTLGLIYAFLRRRASFVTAAGTVALLGFSPFFWDFKDNVLSDVPFLFFVMLGLFAIDRATEGDGAHPVRRGLLAAGAMYLAFGTRTLGVVLVPALLATEIVRRRRVTRTSVIAAAAFAAAAALQMKLIPGGGSYADDLALQSPRLLVVNTWRYVKALERVAFNGVSMPVAHLFFAALVVLAVAGYVSRLRRDRFSPAEAFVPLYATAVIAWPIYQDTRLLIPLIPFFLAYAIGGLGVLAALLRAERLRRPAAAALALAFAFSYVTLYARLDFGPIREGVQKRESREMFSWVRANTGAADVIAFRRPKALALYTGRPSFGYGPGLPDAEQLRDLERMGARYLLASDLDPPYLAAFVARNRPRFEPVFGNGDFVLYRFRAA